MPSKREPDQLSNLFLLEEYFSASLAATQPLGLSPDMNTVQESSRETTLGDLTFPQKRSIHVI